MTILSHRDLMIWQRSMDLAETTYGVTDKFPQSEQYGLTSQMRRAAVSVPSNIAEGYYRSSSKDYARFLAVAKGSLMELETQAELAMRFNYMSQEQFSAIAIEIGDIDRMITSLRSKLRK